MMRNPDELFAALRQSPFRSRFRLGDGEVRYLKEKGLATILAHTRDFVAKRLAPATPHNDGRQTPMRGHPVFIAQHATATCCRGCLAKWHEIPQGRLMSEDEQEHVVEVILRWICAQGQNDRQWRDGADDPELLLG